MNGDVVTVDNYIGGKFVAPSTEKYLDVTNPANLHTIGKVGISNSKDVDDAVAAAEAAFPAWSRRTVKARAAIVSFSRNLSIEQCCCQ
jgi:acyl-CoA reductase-like NAD-dependent aldehyde dehydrogenase